MTLTMPQLKKVETPTADTINGPNDNHPSPLSASKSMPPDSSFSFKIGRVLPGPASECESVPTVSTSQAPTGCALPGLVTVTSESSGSIITAATSTSEAPVAAMSNETVPSAVQQVLAAAASATQNSQVPTPSVLPNPLQQLLSAVALQQLERTSLAAPATVNIIDENKTKRKREEPDPNSTMRSSSNSTSARNLYSVDWCRQNKGGKRGGFATIWDAMEKNNDPLVEEYKKRSADTKAAKKAGNTCNKPPASAAKDDAEED